MKVVAVVVTHNRLELLKRNIRCLRQNKPLDAIVVVNNGSTDGTGDWLASQPGLHVLSQDNVGGSGGFYAGMREACSLSADWIWCMDDDVFPRQDCLERLLEEALRRPSAGILAPRRLLGGKVFTNDFTCYNLTNPFASLYRGRLRGESVTAPVQIKGTAFEGPLVRRAVADSIGFPNKGLFIFCDDTDYCLRAVRAGHAIVYVPSALMDKHPFFLNGSWTERNLGKRWKRFYQVRNSAYLNHHYGKNWAVRYLRGFLCMSGYVLTALATCPFSRAYRLGDVKLFWRAYCDGIRERLGKMG